MKYKGLLISLVLGVGLVLFLMVGGSGPTAAQGPEPQAALGTAFTYQGQLKQDGDPVNGACDFQFSLWDAEGGGTQVGATQAVPGVTVTNGLFTVQLDFGGGAFTSDARWLEIAVRCPAGSGSYATLTPRQALTPAPYALYAKAAPWSGLAGVPAGFADGVDNDTTYTAGYGLVLTGTQFAVVTDTIQARVTGVCGVGYAIRQVNADGTVICEPVVGGGDFWSLTGNAGTNPAANFLGTTDNVALEFRVNNTRIFRIEPNTSPNLIGGYPGNSVTSGVVGATIGGGGNSTYPNYVTDDYGTIGGGARNLAGDNAGSTGDAGYATVGGGYWNRAGSESTVAGGGNNEASGGQATVGGGAGNRASAYRSTVGGGINNQASGEAATVSGGAANYATGWYSTVPGGNQNVAQGYYSFAAGRRAKANHDGTFVWADSTNANFTSTANDQFLVRATGGVAFSTGSAPFQINGNTVWHAGNDGAGSGLDADLLDGQHASAFAGVDHNHDTTYWRLGGNTVGAEGVLGTFDNYALDIRANNTRVLRLEPNATSPNIIGGYSGNSVTSGVAGATIGGGGASDNTNRVTDDYGTVSGGSRNQAGNDDGTMNNAFYATVGGGWYNTASSYYTTVSGGYHNTTSFERATVGGGQNNVASGYAATVSGGTANTANGFTATVGGGVGNTASGELATVPGGRYGAATLYGQMAYASGPFANAGDAQASLYVMRYTSAGTAWTDLYLDGAYLGGAGARLIIASGRTLTFDILVVGRSDAAGGNESAGYRIQGLIENVGGTTAFIGTPSVTALGEDDAAWGVQVLADDTNNALSVQVMGNGETIRWVATVRTAEVAW